MTVFEILELRRISIGIRTSNSSTQEVQQISSLRLHNHWVRPNTLLCDYFLSHDSLRERTEVKIYYAIKSHGDSWVGFYYRNVDK
jgi:hypothetical protein